MNRLEIAKNTAYVAQKNEGNEITVYDAILLGRKPYIKLAPKKEIAKYIVNIIKKRLSDKQCKQINDIIDDIIEKKEMNIVMRLLCVLYHKKYSFDSDVINEKINEDKTVRKIIWNK